MEHLVASVKKVFRSRFEGEPRIFRAPGRINLIGEHTDYNDGFVLPAAIDLQTVVACAARDDRKFAVYALDKDEYSEFDLEWLPQRELYTWHAYVKGTIKILSRTNPIRCGANIVVASTVPIGAGMSSSAALEVAIGYSVLSLNQIPISRLDLAMAGQAAEHEFVGTKSGIMDQFTSASGRKGYAMLLDCRNLTVEYIGLDFTGASLIVCDSGVHHELAASEYNLRREECEEAVDVLRLANPGLTHLRDVSLEEIDRALDKLSSVQIKRARHVVTENLRTLEGARALADQRDLQLFGRLMFQSHESLRYDFEVSCAELDQLVDSARNVDGVFGSRMMGGGFGGSTINLVSHEAKEHFFEAVSDDYRRVFGHEPAFYQVRSADGASEIT